MTENEFVKFTHVVGHPQYSGYVHCVNLKNSGLGFPARRV